MLPQQTHKARWQTVTLWNQDIGQSNGFLAHMNLPKHTHTHTHSRERMDEVILAVWSERIDVAQRIHTKSSTSLCVTSYCVQECTVNTHIQTQITHLWLPACHLNLKFLPKI